MTIDIDEAIARLSRASHPDLAQVERCILAQIDAPRASRFPAAFVFGVAAAAGAASLGIASAGSPPAPAATALASFGSSSPLAPSTLLASAE